MNMNPICRPWWSTPSKSRLDSGVKLLWGTANVFSNPRYMNGATTNPDFNVLPWVATQVKNALDATIALGW